MNQRDASVMDHKAMPKTRPPYYHSVENGGMSWRRIEKAQREYDAG